MSMIEYLILAWFAKFGKSHAWEVWDSLKSMLPTNRTSIYRNIKSLHKLGLLAEVGRESGRSANEKVIYDITDDGRAALQGPVEEYPSPLELLAVLWLLDGDIGPDKPCRELIKLRKAHLSALWMAGVNNPHTEDITRSLHDYYFSTINQEISMLSALLEASS